MAGSKSNDSVEWSVMVFIDLKGLPFSLLLNGIDRWIIRIIIGTIIFCAMSFGVSKGIFFENVWD